MIRKFFAALGCAVLGAAVMLLALPLLPKQLLPHGRAETLAATEAETAPAEPADEPFDEAVTLRVLVDGTEFSPVLIRMESVAGAYIPS